MIPTLAAGFLIAIATATAPDDGLPDPPPVPACAALVPANAPRCQLDGAWTRCPTPHLRALKCEIRVISRDLRDARDDLQRALDQGAGRDGTWSKGVDLLRAQRDEAREAAASALPRARWALALGAGGVGGVAAGVALAASGQPATGIVAAVVGAGLVAVGVGLTW